MKFTYPAIIHNDPDGIWANFPDLPGCQTYAKTLDELFEPLREAMACYILEALAHNDKLKPPGTTPPQLRSSNEHVIHITIDVNQERLMRRINDIESGNAKLVHHELLDD